MAHSLDGNLSSLKLDLISPDGDAHWEGSQFWRMLIFRRAATAGSLARVEIPILGIILLVTAISVLVAPDATLRATGVNLPTLWCPFYAVLDFPCLFCGLTRSFMSMGALDIRQAFIFHPLGPLFYVAMLGLGVASAWSIVARRQVRISLPPGLRNNLIRLGAGIILAAWPLKVVVWYQVGLL